MDGITEDDDEVALGLQFVAQGFYAGDFPGTFARGDSSWKDF